MRYNEKTRKFELDEGEFHHHASNDDGLCLACGNVQIGGVEPDAEDYECGECGKNAICGF